MNKPLTKAERDEAEIRALIADWSRAVEAKDAAAIVAAYADDTLLFDAIPPACTIGADAIRAAWASCLPHLPDRFRSEHRDLTVTVDGNVAFVHGFHRFRPEPPDHPCGCTWMRITVCFRRVDGAWRVVHEHVSIPFDPASGQATLITDL